MSVLYTKAYAPPPVSRREILRYMRCPSPDAQTEALIDTCLALALPALEYRVCARRVTLKIQGDTLDFGLFTATSAQLASALAHCGEALLFAATLGLSIDRIIATQSRLSPAKALCLQAIATERVEALCNTFTAQTGQELEKNGHVLLPRFSPGYGDLALDTQRALFCVLDCPRQIGLTLNDTLLMTPTKSVTAIAGIQ